MRLLVASALSCLLLLLSEAAPAGAAGVADPEQAVLGNWLVESRDGIIQIARAADGSYQGTIVGGADRTRLDEHNPDPSKRHNTLRGTTIMTHLHYKGASQWADGAIYDPDSGKNYKCRMELLDGERLRIRGFLGISLLGRSQVWTRYTGTSMDLPPAAH